ncbi:MAG: hypothetical protein ACI8S7_000382 [Candidatus Krumholzibacteriia bacterium]|jgi:hypothetical protein
MGHISLETLTESSLERMAILKTINSLVKVTHAATRRVATAVLLLLMVCAAVPAAAWMDVENPIVEMGYNPNGIFILDGSYVMNVGEVQINITNWGLIGSMYSSVRPWSDAPSCQWPAGSGNEYLWASGLWIGGVVLGERLCSTGGSGSEMYPIPEDIEATIYEAIGTKLLRPSGNPDASGRREPMPSPDDDDDGLIDEEILNGFDDDDDGLIDEDFAQIGNQMFVLTNYDNTRLAQENYPNHKPMNLEIVQTTFQWENDLADDFVGFDYVITNVGVTDIDRVYIGFFSDADIGPRGGSNTAADDLAGSWPATPGSPGLVRASDGSFVPIQVGYMYDGAENDRLDGYFGVVFLGHDVDPAGRFAPVSVGMATFQSFSGSTSFDQGGDPSNDDERYQLMSAPIEEWDQNTQPGKEADFRFLVSAGPFDVMPPGGQLTFQVGMVVGSGLGTTAGGQGLLANCAEAALTWYGIYTDVVNSVETESGITLNPGQLGRETMLCREDFQNGSDNPWDNFKPDYMDQSCLDPEWILSQPGITEDDRFTFTVDGVAKTCAMFNMDNCFECSRQLGRLCDLVDFEDSMWTCNIPNQQPESYAGCTGINGLENQINWLVGMAPPPPGLRVWPTDSRVHVFWDDLSMITEDIRLGEIDFESYRIWRADNWDRPFGSSVSNGPEGSLWQMIAEYDLVNSFVSARTVGGVTQLDTIPLGANTGLEVVEYEPIVLAKPEFAGLADSMQVVVDLDPDNNNAKRPEVRNPDGSPNDIYFPIIGRWETETAAMDTFWAVAFRGEDFTTVPPTREKHSTNYFEYVDLDVHNGFIYFYSVTATDHKLLPATNELGIDLPVGPGFIGNPGSSFTNTVPGAVAQTAEERARDGVNIYVYPNPATRDALAEYQELFTSSEDPTGVRITFTNMPAAKNTLKIYTIAGDWVQTIQHDGLSGSGHTSWNLMSRNGQEIVSGVYLYTVQSDNSQFEDFVGKFVVVR